MTKLDELLIELRKYIPQANVKPKSASWFMRLLSALVFWNSNFANSFIITFGYTSYFPDIYLEDQYDYLNVETLAHEFVHMWDFNNNKVFFSILYAMPQILGVFTLLALGAFASKLWLIALVCLLFLLPLPAYWRMNYEFRGYVMDMAVKYWRENNFNDEEIYVDQFINGNYYFMWPFKNGILKRFETAKQSIIDNSLLNDEPYKIVHDWVKDNY
jgi:hypothetical protein